MYRFRKGLILLAMLVGLLTVLASPVLADANGEIVRAYRVNLRTGPSIAYPSIAQLVRGQQVKILGYSSNWAQVWVSDTLTGWVNSQYVAVIVPPPANTPPSGSYNAIVNAVSLNVRSGPSTFYGVIGKLTSGTAVNLVGRTADNTWVVVNAPGGLQGWVSVGFVNATIIIGNLPISGTIFAPASTPAASRDQCAGGNCIGSSFERAERAGHILRRNRATVERRDGQFDRAQWG